MMKAK